MRERLLMIARPAVLLALLSIAASANAAEDVLRTETNDGNLVMEDVPPIPQQVVDDLNRYQNVRSARFLDWAGKGEGTSAGVYVATRFADVDQIHSGFVAWRLPLRRRQCRRERERTHRRP